MCWFVGRFLVSGFVGLWVGRLVGWSVGWWVGRLVCRPVGWLFVGPLLCLFVGPLLSLSARGGCYRVYVVCV